MWTGIVVIGVLGYVLNWLFLRVEARVLFWHRGAKGLLGDSAATPATDAAAPAPDAAQGRGPDAVAAPTVPSTARSTRPVS